MNNSADFLVKAKQALGHSVGIIAGREEARLIYLGVAHTLSDDYGRRLVIDIGGGSTEFIIGKKFQPLELESINVGSVSITQKFFPDGHLSQQCWKQAHQYLSLEMTPLKTAYRNGQWDIATGASGTIKATLSIIQALGLEKFGITLYGLHAIRDYMIEAGNLHSLKLPGLKEDRLPVFAGGLAVLIAAFETLLIDEMNVSNGALREGLLYDMIGRIHHEDIRENTVTDLIQRFKIDKVQLNQVEDTSRFLFEQLEQCWKLKKRHKQLLLWSAQLHELGLNISHSRYHKHGAYILEHADLPGFSRKEQAWLSVLVSAHRRKIEADHFDSLPKAQQKIVKKLAVLLRLSVLLHRSRMAESILPKITADKEKVILHCKKLTVNLMLVTDLKRENKWIEVIDFSIMVH
jgi:exopolyphosphatase/guanosine-5'-triphosphate,3'-diphosphate pyrophosphatase